jgi:hypothetical protein
VNDAVETVEVDEASEDVTEDAPEVEAEKTEKNEDEK